MPLPTKDFLHELLHGESNRMSHTFRYNSVPAIRKETVAEHSWKTSYIALNLYWYLRRESPQTQLDLGTVLSKAILHDVPEMLSSDVVTTLKHYDEKVNTEINRVQNQMFSDYIKEYKIHPEIYYDAIWAKAQQEGEVIAVSDLLCVFSYLMEEINSGNKRATKYIPPERLKQALQQLESKLTIDALKNIVKVVIGQVEDLIEEI